MSESPWHLIGSNAPVDRLQEFLQDVFPKMPQAARRYKNAQHLNGLFEWTHFNEPWQLQALVLSHGLGADGEVYDYRSIGIRLKRSERVIQNELRPGNVNGPRHKLRSAHAMLAKAPQSALHGNAFRSQLGLLPREWSPLTSAGIFTIEDLCRQQAVRIERLPGMGVKLFATLQERLAQGGYSLA